MIRWSAVAAALLLVAAPGGSHAQAKARLLYVLDAESEAPIEGATVRDIVTRNTMKTSAAGLVGLLVPQFVRKDRALIEVSMAGYVTSERTFVNPSADTTIVVYLRKVGTAAPRTLARQRADSTVLQVAVVDAEGNPFPDAAIALTRDSAVIASATSDTTGYRTFVFPQVVGLVDIAVTRIGFAPYRQTARLSAADTIVAVAIMAKAQTLAAIKVTAARSKYHLDANDLLGKKLTDALDAIRKLRPAMFGARQGFGDMCLGGVGTVFVNGVRIYVAPRGIELPWIPKRVSRTVRTTVTKTGRVQTMTGARPVGEEAMTDVARKILASIKPEHVAEMTYLNCYENTVNRSGMNNAVYVVLKPGIEYDVDAGSFEARKP